MFSLKNVGLQCLQQKLRHRFSGIIMISLWKKTKRREQINLMKPELVFIFFHCGHFWRRFIQEYPQNIEGQLNFENSVLQIIFRCTYVNKDMENKTPVKPLFLEYTNIFLCKNIHSSWPFHKNKLHSHDNSVFRW